MGRERQAWWLHTLQSSSGKAHGHRLDDAEGTKPGYPPRIHRVHRTTTHEAFGGPMRHGTFEMYLAEKEPCALCFRAAREVHRKRASLTTSKTGPAKPNA